MSPEQRMFEAAKRSIDDMLEREHQDEEFLEDQQDQPDDDGQGALLQMFGVTAGAQVTNASNAPQNVDEGILRALANGY